MSPRCAKESQDGTIDAIASDHAPHHINLKMLEFDRAPFGITGLETAVGLALTQLKLPLARLIELFSLNPQKIMKVKPWGLFEGSAAHLTVLDPAREVEVRCQSVPVQEPEFSLSRMGHERQSCCYNREWQGRV